MNAAGAPRKRRAPLNAWVRRAFALYALGLFTGTHWPKLQIEGPIPRPDLVLHLTCFGGWSLLLTWCGFFGPPCSRRNIAWSTPIGLCYAALDEGLQAIPIIHRVCAWDDFLADCLGILAGVLIASIICVARARPAPQNAP